ncbi:MAG: hypothetical protein V1754_15405, partial [Pseudomonadota bacterium]
ASLLNSLVKATGKDYSKFIDKWVHGKGYPTYSVNVDRSFGKDTHGVEVMVTSGEDFQVPVEIEIVTADGKSQREKLPVEEEHPNIFTYQSDTESEVIYVKFDPDKQLVGRSKGALAGDLQLNGEVDGIDLVYLAYNMGKEYDWQNYYYELFPVWADLVFDGKIDAKDLEVVLASFGMRTGE